MVEKHEANAPANHGAHDEFIASLASRDGRDERIHLRRDAPQLLQLESHPPEDIALPSKRRLCSLRLPNRMIRTASTLVYGVALPEECIGCPLRRQPMLRDLLPYRAQQLITFVRVGNVGARLLKLGDEIVEDLAVSLEDVHGASEASAALRCVQTHLLVHLRERRQHVRDVTLKGNCRVLLATFEEWCRL